MKIYFLAIGFILLMSAVSAQHEYHAAHYPPNTQTGCNPTVSFSDCKPAPNQSAYAQWETPVWHVIALIFGWPNGVGVCALFMTLVAIADQAVATRNSAEAAGAQIAVQRLSLRPRLNICNFINNVFEEARRGEWVTVNMKFSNSGGIPAYNVIVDTWIEFVSGIPPYRLTDKARFRTAAPIVIDTGTPQGFTLPLHRRLNQDEIHQMVNFQGAICFRVRMNYKAFTEEVHF